MTNQQLIKELGDIAMTILRRGVSLDSPEISTIATIIRFVELDIDNEVSNMLVKFSKTQYEY